MEQNGASPWYLRIVASWSRRPGQDLVRIGLVARRPTESCPGGRSSTECSATASSQAPRLAPKWPPISPTGVDDVLADLLRHLRQLLVGESVEVLRLFDPLQEF